MSGPGVAGNRSTQSVAGLLDSQGTWIRLATGIYPNNLPGACLKETNGQPNGSLFDADSG